MAASKYCQTYFSCLLLGHCKLLNHSTASGILLENGKYNLALGGRCWAFIDICGSSSGELQNLGLNIWRIQKPVLSQSVVGGEWMSSLYKIVNIGWASGLCQQYTNQYASFFYWHSIYTDNILVIWIMTLAKQDRCIHFRLLLTVKNEMINLKYWSMISDQSKYWDRRTMASRGRVDTCLVCLNTKLGQLLYCHATYFQSASTWISIQQIVML